jgi:U4/U6.U5 tri-snRNP-associated protein 2
LRRYIEATHHVFMNLDSAKVYCLPDQYEVVDRSLDDIRHVLNPKFGREQVAELDTKKNWSRGLDGTDYLTGGGVHSSTSQLNLSRSGH